MSPKIRQGSVAARRHNAVAQPRTTAVLAIVSGLLRRIAPLALTLVLAGCGDSATGDPSPTPGDTTPPTVTSVTPANGTTGVALNTTVTANFSEVVAPSSLSGSSFTLVSDVGISVAGIVTVTGNTVTFAPSVRLANTTRYTAMISAVRDSAGNALASNYAWGFTTGAAPDVTAPTVVGTSPQNGAAGVASNTVISVTFSEPMANNTITPASLVVAANGSTVVPGVVNVVGTTATFTPTADFAPSTLYAVTITTAVQDASGNALGRNFVLTFTTGATPDVTAPTVIATTPASGATGVARNTTVTATFSETIQDATITSTSFLVTPSAGGSAIAGTVTVAGSVATFTPAATLAGNTQYSATITTAVTDATGNPLASTYKWTFTTAPAPDVTPPTITATTPANGATAVAPTTAPTVTFSEPMQNATLTTTSVSLRRTSGGVVVAGAVTVSGNTATFTPAAALVAGTQYTVTVSTDAKDVAGNALAVSTSWSFTTVAPPDITPPTVTATSPTSGATGVAVGATVTATFSEPMQSATLTSASFALTRVLGLIVVPGTVTVSGNTATFTPSSALMANRDYTAVITTAVKDAAGNALAATYTWTFRTAP